MRTAALIGASVIREGNRRLKRKNSGNEKGKKGYTNHLIGITLETGDYSTIYCTGKILWKNVLSSLPHTHLQRRNILIVHLMVVHRYCIRTSSYLLPRTEFEYCFVPGLLLFSTYSDTYSFLLRTRIRRWNNKTRCTTALYLRYILSAVLLFFPLQTFV